MYPTFTIVHNPLSGCTHEPAVIVSPDHADHHARLWFEDDDAPHEDHHLYHVDPRTLKCRRAVAGDSGPTWTDCELPRGIKKMLEENPVIVAAAKNELPPDAGFTWLQRLLDGSPTRRAEGDRVLWTLEIENGWRIEVRQETRKMGGLTAARVEVAFVKGSLIYGVANLQNHSLEMLEPKVVH